MACEHPEFSAGKLDQGLRPGQPLIMTYGLAFRPSLPVIIEFPRIPYNTYVIASNSLCIMHYNLTFIVGPMWALQKAMHYQIYALLHYTLWAIVL